MMLSGQRKKSQGSCQLTNVPRNHKPEINPKMVTHGAAHRNVFFPPRLTYIAPLCLTPTKLRQFILTSIKSLFDTPLATSSGYYATFFQDAIFMISKATELFVSSLANEAFSFTRKYAKPDKRLNRTSNCTK